MNEKISRRITNLGFIMTCLIITYHVGTPSNPLNALDDKWNTYIGNIFNSLASLAMSYFFTVTAFLLFNNLSMKNFKQKLQKRMYSLLVPYILWQVIIVIKQIFQGKVWNIKAFIKYTFLFEAWPADGALWYVYAVFLLMLISPFLLWIFSDKKMGYLIVVLIIIISHSISNNENALIQKIISHGYIGNIISYFPSYLIGAFYGHLVNTDNAQDNLKYAMGVIVVSLIGDGIYSGFFLKIVIRMIPIFLLHLMPIYVEIPKKICKVSFLMYALHQPFLGDTVKYIRNFWNEITELAIVSNIGTRVVELVLIVCLAEVIYHISDKYTPKVLAIMTGGRK